MTAAAADKTPGAKAPPKPVILIVDPSIDITGALVAAGREAAAMRDVADYVLALPRHSRAPMAALSHFAEVIRVPALYPGRTLTSRLAYPIQLLLSSYAILCELKARRCVRLQLNDFYLPHGPVLRLLGYKGQIASWIRIQPARFGRLGRLLLSAARGAASDLVAVSKCIEADVPSSDRLTLIYDCFDPGGPGAARPPVTGKTLNYLANYTPGKGHELAIRAFHDVAPRHPDASLHFHGSDMGRETNAEHKRELEALAASGPGASQIAFHGQALRPDDLYQQAFLALNFSDSESFSLTCLDASAAGLPVIATRCGGPEEIIDHGRTGLLVPLSDQAAAAAAIERLLNDPDTAWLMGERGRAHATAQFSPAKLRARLLELWKLQETGR